MARIIQPGTLANFVARAIAALPDEAAASGQALFHGNGSVTVTYSLDAATAINNIIAQLLDDAISAESNSTVKTRLQAIKTALGVV